MGGAAEQPSLTAQPEGVAGQPAQACADAGSGAAQSEDSFGAFAGAPAKLEPPPLLSLL